MKKNAWLLVAIPAAIALVPFHPSEARQKPRPELVPVEDAQPRSDTRPGESGVRFAIAPTTTTVLYVADFDAGAGCTTEGWTTVDMTAQIGTFFHVDDYAGLNASQFFPLAGTKSLWCGARPPASGPLCLYNALPGYGNLWDQSWCTKTCFAVSADSLLDVSFLSRFHSEPGYDATTLEYTTDCSGIGGWIVIDGGPYDWVGNPATAVAVVGGAYDIGTTGPVRVRVHFESDGAYSDEDGLFNSNGAVHVDNLVVEGLLEDFEGAAPGAMSTATWEACTPPGYGTFAGLIQGWSVLQEDPCVRDLSCMWAFFVGSTVNYSCGGYPGQTAVPYVNSRGQYLANWVVSPVIPFTGSGDAIYVEYDVYRDLPLDNLIFYNSEVRTVYPSGCEGEWGHREFVRYGGQKDWYRQVEYYGDILDLSGGTGMQVALTATDRCGIWCGIYGTGMCHAHAPLFDNVRVYRVEANGPQWLTQNADYYQFQDNFASDGTLTGTVRADMANDILPDNNPNIHPGDSCVVNVTDPSGLALDATFGGAAVYGYVSVWPQGQAGKTGAALSDNPARWPVAGTWTDAGGVQWTVVRLDTTYTGSGFPATDRFCLDLNDNLFTPGDTVCFFYGARGNGALETYLFGSSLTLPTDDREEAAADPAEFTCLPAGGYNRGGDILYVDGMDGRGAQPAFDLAFTALGLDGMVDRFDVRAPSSKLANRLDSRVSNVAVQLAGPYRKILWDSGDLAVTLGDGSGTPEKTNDYGLLNLFLDGLAVDGGVYLCGDDLAEQLSGYGGPSALTFRTSNLPFVLTSGNHRSAYGVSPVATSAGLCFTSDATFVAQGGCPLLNDFDVLEPSGASAMEIAYGAAAGTNGAVLSQRRVNGNGATVGVLLSGFAFEYIADDDQDGVSDRADHLHDVITWLGNAVGQATGAAPALQTTLSPNYPNPFNPQTTISFSLRDRGRVRLAIYDVSGALVRELVNGERSRGTYTEAWDGRDQHGSAVASGVYFYRLLTAERTLSRKMVLLK